MQRDPAEALLRVTPSLLLHSRPQWSTGSCVVPRPELQDVKTTEASMEMAFLSLLIVFPDYIQGRILAAMSSASL